MILAITLFVLYGAGAWAMLSSMNKPRLEALAWVLCLTSIVAHSDAIVLMPGGAKRARAELIAAVTADDWDRARAGFGDAELANE